MYIALMNDQTYEQFEDSADYDRRRIKTSQVAGVIAQGDIIESIDSLVNDQLYVIMWLNYDDSNTAKVMPGLSIKMQWEELKLNAYYHRVHIVPVSKVKNHHWNFLD